MPPPPKKKKKKKKKKKTHTKNTQPKLPPPPTHTLISGFGVEFFVRVRVYVFHFTSSAHITISAQYNMLS